MPRSVSHRILAIVLVLTRLVLGDLMHLPAAQAAIPRSPQPVMMMAGEPCPGMTGNSVAHAEHPSPGNDGTCCRSAECPCLHAPALMVAFQIPVHFGLLYPDVQATEVHRLGEPPAVFFRPPIQTLL